MTEDGIPRTSRRSLIQLVTELPERVTELVHSEIELIKTELIGKLKALGIGAGLFAAAAVVLLFMVGVLLTAAILALSLVMPGWLAALLVALVLLIVAGILALIGWRTMQAGIPPIPDQSIESLKRDLRAIKGIGATTPVSRNDRRTDNGGAR
ncbi:phage holin family protein [Homoserinibacter sp. YIM 151385]|uniref:phage holin family protein n=1 Tax=Homoserinibacter sp. YIM 151385 TaxID=2985506 RepID=UPI0022F07063|nr:phage holin family protein [Homoserinibacter sp. YIM 151385]WBU37181.1 phage holin family protein [Homoserinibacter sp. YIM 151385]